MDNSKISAMMHGKTLNRKNIQKMCDMVANATDVEEKKNVKKHSVLFVGQLPLDDNLKIDLLQTDRILNTSMPYDDVASVRQQLLDALTTQKLLIEEEGSYKLNMKYENAIVKARKIAKAYQLESVQKDEDTISRAKKMYQRGTKQYNQGDYDQALSSFQNAADAADYRMAYYSLGMMYFRGLGTEKDAKKALRYVRKAMILGLAIAEALEEEILASL